MRLPYTFDATQIDPTQTVGNLPVGRHIVTVTSSDIKDTKDKGGQYLELVLTVIDGENKGASGAWRLNINHHKEQTMQIAHRQLSSICHAIGVYQINDTNQLHDKPFIVEVGIQQKNDQQKEGTVYTEVKRVFDINGNEPGKRQSQPQYQQPPQSQPAGWQPSQGQLASEWQPPQSQQASQQSQPQTQQPPQGQPQQPPQWQPPTPQQSQPTPQPQPNPAAWGQPNGSSRTGAPQSAPSGAPQSQPSWMRPPQ